MKPPAVPGGTTYAAKSATESTSRRVAMSLASRLPIAAVVLFGLAAGAPAAAPVPEGSGKDVPLPYPAKSALVLHVNGLEQAKERLTKLVASAVPEEAAKLDKEV